MTWKKIVRRTVEQTWQDEDQPRISGELDNELMSELREIETAIKAIKSALGQQDMISFERGCGMLEMSYRDFEASTRKIE